MEFKVANCPREATNQKSQSLRSYFPEPTGKIQFGLSSTSPVVVGDNRVFPINSAELKGPNCVFQETKNAEKSRIQLGTHP
jgi:hypothetical protein